MSGLRKHEMGLTQRLLYPVFRPIIQSAAAAVAALTPAHALSLVSWQ